MLAVLLSFVLSRSIIHRASPPHLSKRWLNRFLFDFNEVSLEHDATGSPQLLSSPPPTVTLDADDYRTLHAAKILGVRNNDTIRAGVVSSSQNNGFLTDAATIEWIPQGKIKKLEPLAKSGKPPGLLRIHLHNLREVGYNLAEGTGNKDLPKISDSSNVSLILALPRPLQLNRVLPMISQMGVDHLVLTGASKVPKAYFGSHLFRRPQLLRDRLVEGLCQAGDVQLPELHISKQLHHLGHHLGLTLTGTSTTEEDTSTLEQLFPVQEYARVVTHPLRVESGSPHHNQDGDDCFNIIPIRMDQVRFPNQHNRKIVLAVGPEGGWSEPDELNWFIEHGFQQCTLGPRVLRSDCAAVSLLALAHHVVTVGENSAR